VLPYSVHSRIRKINSHGDVIAEIDSRGPESLGLGTLGVPDNPHSLTFLDRHTLVMVSRRAILKLTFP
jgi:hypothetical protein